MRTFPDSKGEVRVAEKHAASFSKEPVIRACKRLEPLFLENENVLEEEMPQRKSVRVKNMSGGVAVKTMLLLCCSACGVPAKGLLRLPMEQGFIICILEMFQ